MTVQTPLSESKRQLLEKMLRGGGGAADKPAPIAPRAPDARIPLSADQRQVWLHAIMAPGVPLYNESITIHRIGDFNRGAMERSVNELLRRHEAWRTAFVEQDGELVQRVLPHQNMVLQFDDVSQLPEAERDGAALQIGSDDARRAIDLSEAPLFRARIVKLANDNHRLYLTLHHIIFDGVSIYRVIVPELAALYEAFARGEPSPLPTPALQYGDYAVWQQEHLQSAPIQRQINYWRTALADAPPKLEVAGDRPRPARATHAGSMETFLIPHDLLEGLKRVSQREGVTLYMTLLAGYQALLHRYSGEEDIIVGGVTDLRRRPELERVVGYFLNTIALRAKPRGELAFREFLAQVRDSVLAALGASEAPFDEVVRALDVRREPGAHPLFNCLFSIEPPVAPFPEGWDLTQMDVVVGGAKFDLYLELDERPDGMHGRFLYSTELYDPSTIRQMIRHWLTILGGVVADVSCSLGELPLLDEAETRQLRVEWNETGRPPAPHLLPEALKAQVRAHPDSVAVQFGNQRVTYAELDARANGIASALAAAGLGRGDLVALCLDRSPDMIAALLAVHRAGAAYLPLDPNFPSARLDFIISDASAAALLTQSRLADLLPACPLPRILIEDIAGQPSFVATSMTAPDDLAYVLYTSGSTGKPKGVEISQRALINLLTATQERPGFGAEDSLLAVTTLSFDIAALELFLPLLSGGEVILAPSAVASDPRQLAALIDEAKPSVMQATPATWRALVESGWQGDRALRILCGGEAFPRDLAEQLLARAGEVWNMYGPTETTIWSTVEQVAHGTGPVPIGRPIANTAIHILDANGNTAPVGVTGELLIGGDGLAAGYRNQPGLTAERFVQSSVAPGMRLYRTGDLARYRPDGTILCLGRVDNDEKIRGFRVSVEEIEGALTAHPAVVAAAVRSWPDASGTRALAAYIVPRDDTVPGPADLRAHVARTLPDYMVPSHFQLVQALPMTPNGKVDRKALPQPSGSVARSVEAAKGQTEERLAAIWCELLRIDSVGRDESFFDLGGHSLLVARLLIRVEQQWGRRIGMAELFRGPRLCELAARIDGGPTTDLAEFVPLQAEGGGLPLLWIDGGLAFRPLAEAMGKDRPFLGLPLGPIVEPLLGPDLTIEAIASAVVATIRKRQPHGPYLIGGWCTNGILAYEVARQLRAAGDQVPLLALGHSMHPLAFQRISTASMRLSKARYHLKAWSKLPVRARFAYALERARGVLEDVGVAEPEVANAGYQIIASAVEKAAYRYTPGTYDSPVVLFQPMERLDVLDSRPGWSLVAGTLEAHDIPGSHGTMVEAPNVAVFAARLRDAIDRACSTRFAAAA